MKAALEKYGYELQTDTYVWSKSNYQDISYSDGDEVEGRIYDIINNANDLGVFSVELRQHCTDWPSLYHLSRNRSNVLRPFVGLLKGARVLEVGAGCGAITRYLGECGANVLALEGSTRRASIARSRTRDLSNVDVIADRFDLFSCGEQFDVVTLIGVLEYANLFVPGEEPALSMLDKVKSLLKPKGRLILAIENQLGLKYFAGAPEDHLGEPMYGIEGRYNGQQPQTYGRRVLENLLAKAGFPMMEFMVPFPDYKFPQSIVTEAGFFCNDFDAAALAWQSVRRDPQLPPVLAFSPELVWEHLFDNGIALELGNSFVVLATEEGSEKFSSNNLGYHFSTNREDKYCTETQFVITDTGEIEVVKFPLSFDRINTVVGNNVVWSINEKTEYISGENLQKELLLIVAREGWRLEDVGAFLKKYLGILNSLPSEITGGVEIDSLDSKISGRCIDLIPQNLIKDCRGDWKVIDQEWVVSAEFPVGFLLFRALLSLLGSVSRFSKCSNCNFKSRVEFVAGAFKAVGFHFDSHLIEKYSEMEAVFQAEVHGGKFQQYIDWGQNLPIQYNNIQKALIEKEKSIDHLSLQVVGLEKSVSKLNKKLLEYESIINNLQETSRVLDSQLAEVVNSRSWKITFPLRRIANIFRRFRTIRIRSIYQEFPFLVRVRSFRGNIFQKISKALESLAYSSQNKLSHNAIVENRDVVIPFCSNIDEYPSIDLTIVTYNSEKWIDSFFPSIANQSYDNGKISLIFVDNGSSDGTLEQLEKLRAKHIDQFQNIIILRQGNVGYGTGHHRAICQGSSAFFIISNIDLEFSPESIKNIVEFALNDEDDVASWEFRQVPYEHPKHYDPVTLETTWQSHACVLMRRSAYFQVGGYDKKIFMYGEDVELSYRFRFFGYKLRYCPSAFVYHYSYEDGCSGAGVLLKPLQFIGSTYANAAIRIRYGNLKDKLTGFIGLAWLALRPEEPFPGAKKSTFSNLYRLLKNTPHFLQGKGPCKAYYPFRFFDYENTRDGATYRVSPVLCGPKVSIITRTFECEGRDVFLRQAARCVANQTYGNIEWIVVQDGGDSVAPLIEKLQDQLPTVSIKFIPCPKNGRSFAGNKGLEVASGDYCMFLDDDDLLYADHVETLISCLLKNPHASAAYSLAFEVQTNIHGRSYEEVSYSSPSVFNQEWNYSVLKDHNFIPIQSILFNKNIYLERGGFDLSLEQLEDWNLWLRYGYRNSFVFVQKTTSLFRTPADARKRLERHLDLHRAYHESLNRALSSIGEY
ncbi:hypothetical protein DESUT3_22480 [Desulfuromonas versatilis]|uniref:Glycosyl transferase, family 2 n=1 Tax=Desulfuromonas versatilis TaxID=2802975 RepID=A0ABM8HQB2_9BACT|nr:glycosyltransferase [Desulfuromonas versatilis]BCR05179.1 hypothetical protein DESUT3_22480 [Desulfuromonas versatilis]